MTSSEKKIAVVFSFYATTLVGLTWVIACEIPSQGLYFSLPLFYLAAVGISLLSGYYLFFSDIVDIKHKGKIHIPNNRDITKRKVLMLAFIYSVFFVLMFFYSGLSIITFALWPIIVSICLLLIFDRRLIFNVEDSKKDVKNVQKYGIRLLMTFAAFTVFWYFHHHMNMKISLLKSNLLVGWELVGASIWCMPIILISALIIADWVTVAILHESKNNFFKRSDVILFVSIQILALLFMLLV